MYIIKIILLKKIVSSNEELNYVLIQKIEIEGVNCGKNEK